LHPSDTQSTITNTRVNMDWKVLTDESQLQEIIAASQERPQIIFKHSTRCSISSVAKSRLDRSTAPHNTDFYFLDLIRYRSLSNKISETFKVHHESPQVLVISKGSCIYDESHMGIDMEEIKEQSLRN
jgi:bacillithiol system protein YtxJ